ncbi:MAG: ABC transporter ATP-binding protein [Opitutaceae bacterium]|nr:ABC transporter ATP-binding protein [Opitutaceae bacterium]
MTVPLDAHVVLRGVAKRFGDGPPVLAQVDFAVQLGSFVSLIGPSGCGKSTLLRMIAALSPATSGEILIDGRSPERGQPGVAFIFQEPTLLPWLPVQANIEVPLRIRRVARAERERRAAEMLRLVRLEHVRGHYPRELSGGMKMRVSVARALVQSPRLLLMDEPFGALDEMTRHHLNEELLEIREAERWTAFFVTHSVAEAVFLSDRILVMAARPGCIVADVPVPFAYPRGPELREQRDYHDLVDRVAQLLRAGEKGEGR